VWELRKSPAWVRCSRRVSSLGRLHALKMMQIEETCRQRVLRTLPPILFSALSGSSSVPKRSDRGELKPQEQDSVSISRGLHDDGERKRLLPYYGQMRGVSRESM
jgi:hypothetical protein